MTLAPPSSARRGLRALFVLLALAGGLAGTAEARFTRAQLAALPAYCADSELSFDYMRFGPRWQYWVARMGPNFNRIHHYCQSLMEVAQLRKLPPGSHSRAIAMKNAMGGYNFILDLTYAELKDFPLWPEMLVKRGELAVMMEDWPLALSSYEDARRVKPDYPPAYLGWAEVLAKFGKQEEARTLLKQGLAQVPKSEPMRQLYVKLGGSLNDIPDAAPAKPADAPEAAASTAGPAASEPTR